MCRRPLGLAPLWTTVTLLPYPFQYSRSMIIWKSTDFYNRSVTSSLVLFHQVNYLLGSVVALLEWHSCGLISFIWYNNIDEGVLTCPGIPRYRVWCVSLVVLQHWYLGLWINPMKRCNALYLLGVCEYTYKKYWSIHDQHISSPREYTSYRNNTYGLLICLSVSIYWPEFPQFIVLQILWRIYISVQLFWMI